MKTNYKEALLFIAYDTRVTHLEIDKDFEEDGKYSVMEVIFLMMRNVQNLIV